MSKLFTPYSVKGLSLKNRIVMAPMCQYSVEAKDGTPNDWHFVHYVSRAVGGTGLIIVEMTDVEPDGRITDYDLGLWSDEQIPAYARIVEEVHKHDAKIGIQIAHAGRKATDAKQPVSSSNIPVESDGTWKEPRPLTIDEINEMVNKYKEAARRAVEAGFDTIELHGAHGYLIHQFHSPSINNRTDEYGKDYAKFGVEVIRAVKSVIPEDMPLLFRISAIEYIDGGYGLEHSLEIAKQYKEAGVDVFHVSSGGEANPGKVKPANTPGYQVPFARAYKQALDLPVIAVGILEEPVLAEKTLAEEDIELIAIGRGMLKDPYWALHTEEVLDGKANVPKAYKRGF
ncbi:MULTISPECIES: NADH:flavin oxidoreductase/NADH oxidase [unclassified Psychrobacillus]|uniref:NADH:flavin oxidoreductase/NADH oxidase n=1 Tax=unclassified Psychrobacillus TaxID=2636677 RepID=UPI00146C33DD|nr:MULTISPECIES: NADH:flavin oxidoreductase/NADH oxidase [unclassified Psychrobacillus]MCM3357234.1 NADH:flavin oxidoreductase/NADH oxidase [Psychrobacillus sp. MER TA 171]NME04546.1 NADH:flavin oxidoreductase/NADH oxidase [Psychrobacillus sp. BL-248-WT-3]